MSFAITLLNAADGIRSKIFPPNTWTFQVQILNLYLGGTTTNFLQTWHLHFCNYENMENRDGRSKTLCTCQNDRREFWDNQLKMKQHSIL